MSKTLALISLWRDSGRIKGKEVLLVDGFPLYFYATLAAKDANVFGEIHLLSNRPEVSKMAKLLEVKEFSHDLYSYEEDVIKDFLKDKKMSN